MAEEYTRIAPQNVRFTAGERDAINGIGDLAELLTVDKSTLVAAINEVYGKGSQWEETPTTLSTPKNVDVGGVLALQNASKLAIGTDTLAELLEAANPIHSSGSNGIWSWRIWKDGKFELWGVQANQSVTYPASSSPNPRSVSRSVTIPTPAQMGILNISAIRNVTVAAAGNQMATWSGNVNSTTTTLSYYLFIIHATTALTQTVQLKYKIEGACTF
jgi:hypothetical protein